MKSEVLHLLYWSSAVGMLVTQAFLARAHRSAATRGVRTYDVVWAIVPALLLLSLGLAT